MSPIFIREMRIIKKHEQNLIVYCNNNRQTIRKGNQSQ